MGVLLSTRPQTGQRTGMSDSGALTLALKGGSHHAFEELMKTYMRRVYAVGFRMTRNHAVADDLAQEAFLRLWEHRESLDEAQGVFGYLRRTVVNLALNRSRRREVTKRILAERVKTEAGRREAPPPEKLEARERAKAIEDAIESLPEDRRTVIVLRVYEEMSYDEISQATGLPRGTVMSRLHRARMEVREALQASQVED